MPQTIFSRVGGAIIGAGFVGRANRQGSGFSRWGVREVVQVDSVRSTAAAAITTELSGSLTRQCTRELLCRRRRCLLGLQTRFVSPADTAVHDRFTRTCRLKKIMLCDTRKRAALGGTIWTRRGV